MLLPRSINNRLCCLEKFQTDTEKRLNALDALNVVNYDGPAFTLGSGDAGNYLRFFYFADGTVTVSTDMTTGELGASTILFNEGAGNRTIIAGPGVTLNASSGSLILPPYAYATLIEVGPNEFDVLVATAGNPPVTPPPVVVNPPTVSGNRIVGQTLTATPATWTTPPAGGVTRQWFRDGVAISGATNLTYVLTTNDAGALVSVVDTGSNSGGSTASGSTETDRIASLLAAITTDVGSTPTTPRITLKGSQNAVRVWSGDHTAIPEPYFTLYVTRDGVLQDPIRMHNYESYVIACSAGEVLAFATADGRALKMVAMVYDTVFTTSFPVSGTANADQAGPGLSTWTPPAAHITLPGNGLTFEIAASGSEDRVFISEYDGVSWTPYRSFRRHASVAFRYKASQKRVALANYAGTALTINAPTGTTIGGSKAVMHLPFTAVTGTTRNVSNVAQLLTAIGLAVAGDEIVLADGTYALTQEIISTSFASNYVSGRQGGEGIMIRSASGNRAACIITGDGTGENGNWELGRNTFTANPLPFMMRDLKFDFSGKDAGFLYQGGYFLAENVENIGVQLSTSTHDLWSVGSHIEGYNAILLRCIGTDAYADIYNIYGAAGLTTGSVKLIDCIGARAGGFSNSQVLTPHEEMDLFVYGGTYSDANTFVVQGSVVTDPTWMFFATTAAGTRKAALYYISAYGCDLSGITNDIKLTVNGFLVGNKIATLSFASAGVVREAASESYYIAGNQWNLTGNAATVPAYYPNVNTATRFRRNLVTNGLALLISSDTGSSTVDCTANGVVTATTGFNLKQANLYSSFLGNITKGTTTSLSVSSGSAPRVTPKGYNVLAPTPGIYVPGTGDLLGTAAQLDSLNFPTVGGNCHQNVSLAQLGIDYVGGDTDAYGFINGYAALSSPTACRGPKTRPEVVAGAALYPDLVLPS